MQPKELAKLIGTAVSNSKGTDIMLIDLMGKTIIADYFVIASALNATHSRAIAENLDEFLSKKHGIEPAHREGLSEGRWIALDYGSVIVHIFHQETRAFYQLERLWIDGANVTTITD